MRRSATVAAGLVALAATAVQPAVAASFDAMVSTHWQWSEGIDRITDQRVSRATLLTVTIDDMALGQAQARVGLTCLAGKPILDVDWSFNAAGKANLTLEYRFAGQPGRSLKARYVNRGHELVTDLSDIRRFLEDARASDSLRVRVNSDAYGVVEATFKAGAGADMVRRFIAACPVAALP